MTPKCQLSEVITGGPPPSGFVCFTFWGTNSLLLKGRLENHCFKSGWQLPRWVSLGGLGARGGDTASPHGTSLGDLWVTGKRIGVEGREVARPRLCGAGHSVGHCPESGVREGGGNEGGSPPGGKAAGTQRDSQKARVVL